MGNYESSECPNTAETLSEAAANWVKYVVLIAVIIFILWVFRLGPIENYTWKNWLEYTALGIVLFIFIMTSALFKSI